MGYNITIGELKVNEVNKDSDDYDGKYVVKCEAELINLPDAPAFPYDVNPSCNYRYPSYTVWYEFANEVGLYDLFYDEHEGLMREHPGCFALKREHFLPIDIARLKYESKYPKAIPGFNFDPNWSFKNRDDGVRGRDGTYARLLWLHWWVKWALDNCQHPCIYNS